MWCMEMAGARLIDLDRSEPLTRTAMSLIDPGAKEPSGKERFLDFLQELKIEVVGAKEEFAELPATEAKRLMKEMDPPGAEKAYFALGCCEWVGSSDNKYVSGLCGMLARPVSWEFDDHSWEFDDRSSPHVHNRLGCRGHLSLHQGRHRHARRLHGRCVYVHVHAPREMIVVGACGVCACSMCRDLAHTG